MPRVRACVLHLLLLAVLWLATADVAHAVQRDVWVAAVPASFDMVPWGRDPISGQAFTPQQRIVPTVIFRRTRATGAARCATRTRAACRATGCPVP